MHTDAFMTLGILFHYKIYVKHLVIRCLQFYLSCSIHEGQQEEVNMPQKSVATVHCLTKKCVRKKQ